MHYLHVAAYIQQASVIIAAELMMLKIEMKTLMKH